MNQNTTNEQWIIHEHHSFVFIHILHDRFLDYVTNSMRNYMTCKYRDLSFLVDSLQKILCLHVYIFFQNTMDTKPKTFEGFSILNTGNTFILSISQIYESITTLF